MSDFEHKLSKVEQVLAEFVSAIPQDSKIPGAAFVVKGRDGMVDETSCSLLILGLADTRKKAALFTPHTQGFLQTRW